MIEVLAQVPCMVGISLRSKRFRASSSTKLGREQKKEVKGEGEGSEGNACLQTPRF